MLHRQFSELVDRISDQIISYHETIILTVILQDTHSHNWTDHRPFFEVTWLPLCYYCLHLCIPGMKNVFKNNVWVLKNDGIPISSRVELSGLNRGHQIVSHSRLKTPLQFFLVLRGHHWLNSYWPCLACVASAIIVEREVLAEVLCGEWGGDAFGIFSPLWRSLLAERPQEWQLHTRKKNSASYAG